MPETALQIATSEAKIIVATSPRTRFVECAIAFVNTSAAPPGSALVTP
jgi:hypothetical protein